MWNEKAQVLLFLGIYKGSKFIDDLPYFPNILENQILDGELWTLASHSYSHSQPTLSSPTHLIYLLIDFCEI